jgi:hypothetical protein
MRNAARVGTAITLSQITAGDFFYLHNTSVGAGVTSYEDVNGTSAVGVGTTHLDNIYRCQAVEYGESVVIGIGTTGVQRVTVSVSSSEGFATPLMNNYFGNYSFGKLTGVTRDSDPHAFSVVTSNGITGLSTAPVIRRLRNIKRSY